MQAKLGGKEPYHEGDAAKNLFLLCYKGQDGSFITFESGELGGVSHIISSISISSLKIPDRLKTVCTESESVNKGLMIAPGIRLGLTMDQVKAFKGEPKKSEGSHLYYEYESTRKTSIGEADILSSLDLQFVGKTLSNFKISRVETY